MNISFIGNFENDMKLSVFVGFYMSYFHVSEISRYKIGWWTKLKFFVFNDIFTNTLRFLIRLSNFSVLESKTYKTLKMFHNGSYIFIKNFNFFLLVADGLKIVCTF